MNDDSHLRSEEFHLLPDDSPGGRAKRYRNSFVLAAILQLNKYFVLHFLTVFLVCFMFLCFVEWSVFGAYFSFLCKHNSVKV